MANISLKKLNTKPISVSSVKSTIVKKAAAFLTNGNYVITWSVECSDPEQYICIHTAIFDKTISDKKLYTIESSTNLDLDNESQASVIAHSSGFLLSYLNYGTHSNKRPSAYIYDVTGNRITTFEMLSTYYKPYSVASVSHDRVLTVWEDYYMGFKTSLYAQLFNNINGIYSHEIYELIINTQDLSILARTDTATTELTNGKFVAAWTRSDGDGIGIYFQMFDDKGNIICKTDNTKISAAAECNNGAKNIDVRVTSGTKDDQRLPSITALSNGGFVITWESGSSGNSDNIYGQIFDNSDIYAQIFNADGYKLCRTNDKDLRYVNECGQSGTYFVDLLIKKGVWKPSVAALYDGNFIVNYEGGGKIFTSWGKMINENKYSTKYKDVISDSRDKLIGYYVDKNDGDKLKADIYKAVFQYDSSIFALYKISTEHTFDKTTEKAVLINDICIVTKPNATAVLNFLKNANVKTILSTVLTKANLQKIIFPNWSTAKHSDKTAYDKIIKSMKARLLEEDNVSVQSIENDDINYVDIDVSNEIANYTAGINTSSEEAQTFHDHVAETWQSRLLGTSLFSYDPGVSGLYTKATQSKYSKATQQVVLKTDICIVEKPSATAVLNVLKNANVKTALSTVLTKANLKIIFPDWNDDDYFDKKSYDKIIKSLTSARLLEKESEDAAADGIDGIDDVGDIDGVDDSVGNFDKSLNHKTSVEAFFISNSTNSTNNTSPNIMLANNTSSASAFGDVLNYDDAMLILGLSSVTLVAVWN